jgi:hypothetical protein
MSGTIETRQASTLTVSYTPRTTGPLSALWEVHLCAADGDRPAEASGPAEGGVEETVRVVIRGTCSALPVHFAQEECDLRTCLVGRTYAGSIAVANTSNVAARATLSLPAAARAIVQIANKTLHIQPKVGGLYGVWASPFVAVPASPVHTPTQRPMRVYLLS